MCSCVILSNSIHMSNCTAFIRYVGLYNLTIHLLTCKHSPLMFVFAGGLRHIFIRHYCGISMFSNSNSISYICFSAWQYFWSWAVVIIVVRRRVHVDVSVSPDDVIRDNLPRERVLSQDLPDGAQCRRGRSVFHVVNRPRHLVFERNVPVINIKHMQMRKQRVWYRFFLQIKQIGMGCLR